jgi:putative thioredoxin
MSESPYIHNVGMNNFQQLVLEKSVNKPVLVDFWADWCQPCQTIMPMLAKLAEEYGGKFELAKVNADQEQELAAHFGIKSLPTMKLFYQGQLVDERMGALPESEIRAMLDKHIVSESDKFMQAAMMAYQQGQTDQALEMLNHALANDPENAELKVTIAQMVHAQGDTESAVALLDSLDEEGSKLDAAIKLRAEIKLAAQLADLPSMEEIEKRLAEIYSPGRLRKRDGMPAPGHAQRPRIRRRRRAQGSARTLRPARRRAPQRTEVSTQAFHPVALTACIHK